MKGKYILCTIIVFQTSVNELTPSFKRQSIARSRSRQRFHSRTSSFTRKISTIKQNAVCRENFGSGLLVVTSLESNRPCVEDRATKVQYLALALISACLISPWSPYRVNYLQLFNALARFLGSKHICNTIFRS